MNHNHETQNFALGLLFYANTLLKTIYKCPSEECPVSYKATPRRRLLE